MFYLVLTLFLCAGICSNSNMFQYVPFFCRLFLYYSNINISFFAETCFFAQLLVLNICSSHKLVPRSSNLFLNMLALTWNVFLFKSKLLPQTCFSWLEYCTGHECEMIFFQMVKICHKNAEKLWKTNKKEKTQPDDNQHF